MAFGKLLATNYTCPDCGSTAESRVTDLCDTCVIKFYLDDANLPDFEGYIGAEMKFRPELINLFTLIVEKDKEFSARFANASGSDYDYYEGITDAYGVMKYAVAQILGISKDAIP